MAEFVRRGRFSQSFVRQFLIPFGASIWSADPATFMRFPVRAYARFMDNHGLLELAGRPEWRTVTGGSRRYVDALTAPFSRSHTSRHARAQDRHARRRRRIATVEVLTDRGPQLFDRVIVATHSDQALRMLADASTAERDDPRRDRLSDATSPRCTPTNECCRATRAPGELELRDRRQRVRNHGHLLDEPPAVDRDSATLARHTEPPRRDRRPHAVLAEFEYDHPVFDAACDGGPAAPRRDPGPPRHLLRRRLLGLRLPRRRRAERARGRATAIGAR